MTPADERILRQYGKKLSHQIFFFKRRKMSGFRLRQSASLPRENPPL